MAAPASLTVLRRAFADICHGHSATTYRGQPLYIRHLSHLEHIGYDDVQARYEEEGRQKGGLTEAAKMAELKAAGRWKPSKDMAIERQQDTISRFEDTIRNTPQPSVAESMAQQVQAERVKLRALLDEKAELLGMTVEIYAQRMLNDHYVLTNLFADPELRRPLFGPEGFGSLSPDEVDNLLEVYHGAIDTCGDGNLRQLAVQDLFTSYWNVCGDNASTFYGRPVYQMTYYQIRLASIARYFKSILEGVDMTKLAPAMRTDPEALERFYTSQRAIEQQKAEGKLPAGMTNADLQQTGLQGQYAQVSKAESAIDLVKRLAGGGRPG